MARAINRGDIWMHTFKAPDKRRPVVVITRQDAIDVMHTIMVAPITSTIRDIPSEVLAGPDDGLKRPCSIKLDNVQTVERAHLTNYIGTLSPARMQSVCRALAIATGCAD